MIDMRRTLPWLVAATATDDRHRRLAARVNAAPPSFLFGGPDQRGRKKRVAVLLAGHVRTHDRCAPSVREHLLEHPYNTAKLKFAVIAMAYEDRWGVPVHLTKAQMNGQTESNVTPEDITKLYPRTRVHVKVVSAETIRREAPVTNNDRSEKYDVARYTYMFRLIRDGFAFLAEVENGNLFDGVLKIRFDLKLLAPFKLHNLGCDKCIVVPGVMALGSSGFAKLGTRCRQNDAPKWVQDHVAYGERPCGNMRFS